MPTEQLDHNGDTIQEAVLRWCEDHQVWHTRLEIAIGVGRSKTSQLVRVIEALVNQGYLARETAREGGRDVFVYHINPDLIDQGLPF